MIDNASAYVKQVDAELLRQLKPSAAYRALNALPGFGPVTSAAFLAEAGDVWRFKRARHLLSYLGIVPRVHSSGGKTRFGGLTKEGPPLARTSGAGCASCYSEESGVAGVYTRIKEKHGPPGGSHSRGSEDGYNGLSRSQSQYSPSRQQAAPDKLRPAWAIAPARGPSLIERLLTGGSGRYHHAPAYRQRL